MALTINGETIDDEIIDGEFGQIKAYYESLASVSCCERDPEFRAKAKDNIIGRVLLIQEVERREVTVSESEVGEAFDRLVDQHGAREHVLLEAGMTLDQEELFRQELGSNLKMEKMLEEVCGDDEEPDDEAVEACYQENIDLFSSVEEVRASHIFKSPQPVEKRPEIFEGLREIRKKALAGEDFDSLIREHSEKPEDESDLGFFKRGELMEEFETIAFSMEIGEVSPVFITQWGFHLAKLTGRNLPVPAPIDEVRDNVIRLWKDGRRKEKVDAFVAGLREDAEIEDDDPDDEIEYEGAHSPTD